MIDYKLIDYKGIGNRVRQRRLDNNLTQEKLAELLQISNEYMSKIETGAVQVNLKRLAQLSLALSTPIEHFIAGSVMQAEDYKLNEISKIFDDLSPKEKDVIYNVIKQIKKLRK